MNVVAQSIEISVNGEPRSVPAGATVSELIGILGLNPELVAVEINRELVRKTSHGLHSLSAGDHVEIVEFVGGG